MDPVFAVLVGVLVLALAGLATWAVLRHRHVSAYRALGWQFVSSPSIEIVHGLNVPPFGLGVNRSVDEQVVGHTSSGMPFQAFEYDSSSQRLRGLVVTMPLPRSLPECHVVPADRGRDGTAVGVAATAGPSHGGAAPLVLSGHPGYAQAVASLVGPLLPQFPEGHPADLSIDHGQLVALGAPTRAADLQVFVEALAPVAQVLSDPRLSAFPGPPPPPELGWYGRPGWVYRVRDDAMLGHVAATGGGRNHRALNVTFSTVPPLPFIQLTHTWETTRTVTESDGRGGTRTRTVTDHHREEIFEIHPTFPFGDLKVNAGWFGDRRTFESSEFNQQFTVRASDPRFAHDVFHPRMMEYLLAARPGPFVHDGQGRLTIEFSGSTTSIEASLAFFEGFFGRVPNYVWQNLGLAEAPVALPA